MTRDHTPIGLVYSFGPYMSDAQWRERARWIRAWQPTGATLWAFEHAHGYGTETFREWARMHWAANAWERVHGRTA